MSRKRTPVASPEQSELPLAGSKASNGTKKATLKPHRPATELMKTVASKTMNEENIKKVFSREEIEEILTKRDSGIDITPSEHKAIREQYRRIKRHAKELEKGNQSRLIVVPSIVTGDGFYKVFDFSALYYVYRLAERMSRSARLLSDNDHFSRMIYMASIVNLDKFIAQMMHLENSDLEITEDKIYIFTLKKPLTDDEVGQLRMIEETRREKLHNVLRPKSMDPAVYQSIMMVIRQVAPRVKKLDRHYYYAIGEGMLKDLNRLLATYFDWANGLKGREEASIELMTVVDSLFASLAILSETRVWDYGVAASIGENINEVRRLVTNDFGVKAKK